MHVLKHRLCSKLVLFLLVIVYTVIPFRTSEIHAHQEHSLCTAARTDIPNDQTAIVNMPEIDTRVVDITYWEEQHMIWIVSLRPDMDNSYYRPHDVQLRHQVLDLETGEVTTIDYPYADIVTPELTDALGITAEVFGEDSRHYMLMVAPQRDKVLFLRYDETVEVPCCGDAYAPYALLSANIDGSDLRYLALARQSDYLENMDWYDNRAVLTFHNMFGGGNTPLQVCLDGSCSAWWFYIQTEDEQIYSPIGAASISPDDRLAVLVPFTDSSRMYIQDQQTYKQREIPVGTDHPQLAPVWESDSQSFYFLNGLYVMRYDLAEPPNNAVSFQTSMLIPGGNFASEWLFLPDYGAMIVVSDLGLTVQCYGTFVAPSG